MYTLFVIQASRVHSEARTYSMYMDEENALLLEIWKTLLDTDDIELKECCNTLTSFFDTTLNIQTSLGRPLVLNLDSLDKFNAYLNNERRHLLPRIKISFPVDNLDFFNNKNLSHIVSLDIRRNRISDEDLKEFLKNKWPHLISLDLRGNEIGPDGLEALAQSDLTSRLTSLNIGYNDINDVGIMDMVIANWSNIVSLDIRGNNIRDAGAKALAQGIFPKLNFLDISSNKIGEAGAKLLAQGKWSNLIYLNVSYNGIGDGGLKAIAEGKWFNLVFLHVGDERKITRVGAKAIAQGKWPKLTIFTK